MPTPSVLAPDAFQTFGDLLKHLRLRAGLTQRDLALAVGYHYAHISRLEHNERLPDTHTLLALFVPALHLEDQPDWALRLLELAAAARGESLPPALAGVRVARQAGPAQEVPLEAPPPAPGPQAGRVPVPLTALLGRETELKAVRQILLRPEVRLLTLVGPPGIGKTRLALQAAADLAGRFRHGALFVDLTAALDVQAVVAAVAQVLEVKEEEGRPLAQAVEAALRDRHGLLLLDNFEQVREAGPLLAGWLRAAPRMKALVTSREHLRVAGENEFSVPPLPVPPASKTVIDLPTLAAYPAVQLFVERAQAVQPGFALTPDNAAAVGDICARLDGLPLAIELAAARVRLLSPQAMQARLDRRLAWLTGGTRDAPAWRQTLRGAIDWSHGLLDPAEQRVFAALGVFAGTFAAHAAEAVTGASLDVLEDLAGKSLIQVLPADGGDAPRLRLLETLREYALEHLRADPAHEAAARRAHADYYLALAERAAAELRGANEAAALRTLGTEYDNLRAAMAWAEAHDPGLGLRLAVCLLRLWQLRGWQSEGRAWFERFLALAPDEPALAEARLRALRGAGVLSNGLGDTDRARAYHLQALERAQAAGDLHMVGNVLNSLAVVAHTGGDAAEAERRYLEVLAHRRAHGNAEGEGQTLNNLGVLLLEQGRAEAAEAYLREALAVRQALGNEADLAQSLHNLAEAVAARDPVEARALAEQSLEIRRTLDVRPGVSHVLMLLAQLDLDAGALDEAEARLAECLRLTHSNRHVLHTLQCLERMAWLAHARAQSLEGDPAREHYRRAVWLLAATDRHRPRYNERLTAHEQQRREAVLAAARAALPSEDRTVATITGAHVELDEMVATVLTWGRGTEA